MNSKNIMHYSISIAVLIMGLSYGYSQFLKPSYVKHAGSLLIMNSKNGTCYKWDYKLGELVLYKAKP
jgi:hypothetical protein